ncbi:NAD(P)-dependent dehydrogenase (short-subunit alcohol dehydrogenase family) [Arthrobacter ginsengisoli]|uniref:NAD(P)-dependent dehydrogenase (Short-subunit alcohol dehydrogenase family) n=1 Tax=Arthrobacter ginsengisoli TaxID=1356565 RepID=A0ABU1UIN6_9MICC|nr:SDR family NAD(P)-dependent oxidoreductase [Arthrobacter ginsengisoli]MDR7085042.1 NAD(P)-dependent dehydrogenase (short-subunit alcohol dehydrogenase family) [Arthrobacter ginsengisoli]
MEIPGSVALVTGGASGLGLATATLLHQAGAKVILVDLQQSDGERQAAQLGAGATFVAADVTDPDQIAEVVKRASTFGPLRIAVNCAGVATPGKIIGRSGPLPLADFDRVIRINLSGTFNVLRLATEAMQALEPVGEERGVVINTASVAAFDGQIGQPAYAASKAAVAGLTLPAAREFASSYIRVMAIAPGIFETPMMAGLPEEARNSLGTQVPHPSRLGRPGEYAALVRHIVENPMLNGETIRLDGAIRMAPR